MSAHLKTLPLLAKIVLLAGLFCGVICAQVGLAQSPVDVCVMLGGSTGNQSAAPMVDCQHCCATMPCCLTSRHHADTPPQPEPLGNERNHQLGQAPFVMTLTLLSSFDFLAPPPKSGVTVRDKAVLATHTRAPRGAVSCIWLI